MVAGSNTFADAPLLPWGTSTDPVSSASLGTEPGEPLVYSDIAKTLWVKVVAPDRYFDASPYVRVDTLQSTSLGATPPSMAVAVYVNGPTLGALSRVASLGGNLSAGAAWPGAVDTNWQPTPGRTYWLQVWMLGGTDVDVVLRVGSLREALGDWSAPITPPMAYHARGVWVDQGPDAIELIDQDDKLRESIRNQHAAYSFRPNPVTTKPTARDPDVLNLVYDGAYTYALPDDRGQGHPTLWPAGDGPTQHGVIHGVDQSPNPSGNGTMDSWDADTFAWGIGSSWQNVGGATVLDGASNATVHYTIPVAEWRDLFNYNATRIAREQAGSIGMHPFRPRPVNDDQHSLDESYRFAHMYPQSYEWADFEWVTSGEVVAGSLALDLKRGGPEAGGGVLGDEQASYEWIEPTDRLLIGYTTDTELDGVVDSMAGWVSATQVMASVDNLKALPTGREKMPNGDDRPYWRRIVIDLPDGFTPAADAKVTCMSSVALWRRKSGALEEDDMIRQRAWPGVGHVPQTWDWRELGENEFLGQQYFYVRAAPVWSVQPGAYRYREVVRETFTPTTVTDPPWVRALQRADGLDVGGPPRAVQHTSLRSGIST